VIDFIPYFCLKNFIGICIADAAEKARVSKRSFKGMILGNKSFDKIQSCQKNSPLR
jgi:hypothetical protein